MLPSTFEGAVASSVSVERVASTRMSKFIAAPRERVYDALLDPEAVARWKVPAGMRCHVHEFNASEGGAIRI